MSLTKIFNTKKIYFLNDSLAFFLKDIFKIDLYHYYSEKLTKHCNNCGEKKKKVFYTRSKPDFDINILPKKISKKFYIRFLGKCLNCNLLQDYLRLNLNENLHFINKLKYKEKSSTTLHNILSAPNYLSEYFKDNLNKRIKKWKNNIDLKKNSKILILRPENNLIINFLEKKFNPKLIDYIDYSNLGINYIKKYSKKASLKEGNIHGEFSGKIFNKSDCYDLIIVNHLMVHSTNLNRCFYLLKKIIKPKGQIIFINEIQIKYHNPFHINLWDENQFKKILMKHFIKVKIIRDCGYTKYSVSPFTLKNDNPDFLVSKKSC